jgi:hypothetical protein
VECPRPHCVSAELTDVAAEGTEEVGIRSWGADVMGRRIAATNGFRLSSFATGHVSEIKAACVGGGNFACVLVDSDALGSSFEHFAFDGGASAALDFSPERTTVRDGRISGNNVGAVVRARSLDPFTFPLVEFGETPHPIVLAE